jgi:hypothetical protein
MSRGEPDTRGSDSSGDSTLDLPRTRKRKQGAERSILRSYTYLQPLHLILQSVSIFRRLVPVVGIVFRLELDQPGSTASARRQVACK